MSDLDVCIERLPPMRVAWVRAISRSPEEDAWRLLGNWARAAGLLDDPTAHPVFGFNNPSPEPGSEEYGYEFWIAVGSDCQPPEGIGLKDFPGGLHATTSCRLPEAPQRWQALVRWVDDSPYTWRQTTHELERIQNPLASPQDITLDLYLPLESEPASSRFEGS